MQLFRAVFPVFRCCSTKKRWISVRTTFSSPQSVGYSWYFSSQLIYTYALSSRVKIFGLLLKVTSSGLILYFPSFLTVIDADLAQHEFITALCACVHVISPFVHYKRQKWAIVSTMYALQIMNTIKCLSVMSNIAHCFPLNAFSRTMWRTDEFWHSGCWYRDRFISHLDWLWAKPGDLRPRIKRERVITLDVKTE